jgi:Arc/MetJ family transcription regulator
MPRIHAVIDDELLAAAERAHPSAPSRKALLEEGLRALVARGAARDLALMVRNQEFELRPVPRRR